MVEGATLEMLCTGNCTVGSNPTSSAIFFVKMRDSLNEMKAIPVLYDFVCEGTGICCITVFG